ncbi:MAG: gas vesicle protein GvpG [Thermoplasmatales archaeon]|nr:gas vesicle protein GvpG [Candidatus Thermoplasmatota archaeon]MCG2825846.1 gas vesicle protein GvpG [Thermoplasmatales archaeon]
MMPFIIDDIFLRMVGISIPPFDMLWIFEQIRDRAYQERYDPEKINDRIKENRMLYELDEISKKDYEERNDELNHELKIANRVNNMSLDKRIDLLGG